MDQVSITEAGYNIFPGYRMGPFVLGNTLEEHFEYILDEEFMWGYLDIGDGYYLHLLECDTTGVGFFLVKTDLELQAADVTDAIYTFLPFEGETEPGITFGNTFAEVESAYGIPDDIWDDGSYDYLASLGIAFWSDTTTESYVEYIYIEENISAKSSKITRDQQLRRMKPVSARSMADIRREED
jgi:hypothetical protein